jgi:predicted transcriptional regulator of viral defense system
MMSNTTFTVSDTRTLGRAEARVVLSLREQNKSLVRLADLTAILESEKSAKVVLRALVRKGWLCRVIGGKYLFQPPERGPDKLGENNALAIAAAVVEPSYIGWWSAAAWYGFTTQTPATVFVAVTRQVPPRNIDGTDIRFIKLHPRKFFGAEPCQVYDRSVLISSPSKTVVDCLDRPDLAGGVPELARIVHSALGSIDPEALLTDILRLDTHVAAQRLGFLADAVGRPLPAAIRTRLRGALPKNFRARLGRSVSREGDLGFNADWGVTVNVSEAELLAEVPRMMVKTSNAAT